MDDQQQQLVSGGGNPPPPNLASNAQPSKRSSVGAEGGGGGRGGQPQPQPQQPQLLKDIVAPHQHDVLCGRGGGTNNHVGNELFRTLVNNKKRAYLNSCKRDKPSVSRGIVASIRGLDPPGRFLSRDEHTGLWFDIGDQKAREKTSQALREGAPEIRKEMGFREWPDGAAGKGPPGGYNRSASAPAHVLSSMMQMQHHRHRQHQQATQQPPPSQQSQQGQQPPQPPPPPPPQPPQRPQPRPSQGPSSIASAAGLPPPQTSFQADAAAAAASQELRGGPPRRPSEAAAAAAVSGAGAGGATGQPQGAGGAPQFPSHITPDAAKVLIQFLQTQQAKDTPGGGGGMAANSALSPSQQQAVAAAAAAGGGGAAEDLASASAQTALLKAAYQQQQLELQSQSERLQQLTQRLQLQQQQQQQQASEQQPPPPRTPPPAAHLSPSLHQYDGHGHRRPSTLVEQLVTGSPAGSELVPPTATMSRGSSTDPTTSLAMERMRRASLAEQQMQHHQRMDVPGVRSASHSFADAEFDAAGNEGLVPPRVGGGPGLPPPSSAAKNGQGKPATGDSTEQEDDDKDYLKDLPPDVRSRLEVAEYLAECHRNRDGEAHDDGEGATLREVRKNAELFQTLGLLGVDAAVIGRAMSEGRPLTSLVDEAVAAGEESAPAPGAAVKMEGVDDTAAVARQVTDDDMVVPSGGKGSDEDATKRVDPTDGGATTTGSVAKGLVGGEEMNVEKDATTTLKDDATPLKKRKLMVEGPAGGEDDARQPFFPRNRIQDALSRMGVVASE